MAYAHKAQIIHRDIKPSNVLIARSGGVYLSDFSLARACEESNGLSSTGELVCSMLYAAPEIYKGEALDYRSDIYSFGILAYEMATGHVPFDSHNSTVLINYHETRPLPKFVGKAKRYPGWFYKFVKKCAAKNKKDRFASAQELLSLLDARIQRMSSSLIIPDADCRRQSLLYQISEGYLKTSFRKIE
ncbi:MAG: serine/threonine protein kinase [Deltaproteobacteria bacterium]|nr:serine/threonine protein kinase [Deltaproteobacteria bacterium]